jgi:hypothetical protein
MIGFRSLNTRIKCQEMQAKNQQGRLDVIAGDIEKLQKSQQVKNYWRGLGPMLRFFKYFRQNILATKLAFLYKILLGFAKFVFTTLGFKKNVNLFAENWRKSEKIVIITSTPAFQVYPKCQKNNADFFDPILTAPTGVRCSP